jgi:cell division protein FtsQ
VVLAVVAGVILLGYLLTRSPLLDVDAVRVSGAVHTRPDLVVAASGITTGDPMTGVDVGAATRAIAELPWVDTVSVTRSWPGRVDITITERQPVAALMVGAQSWSIVDGTGRVLEQATVRPEGLPVVLPNGEVGDPGSRTPASLDALEVVRLLTPDLRAWVDAVQPEDDGTIDLLLRGGIRVELGSPAHLPDKVVDLATVLTRVDLADLATIDVSVVHDTVVTRRAPA